MKNRVIASILVMLMPCSLAFGQQPSANTGGSHKYRITLSFTGGGAGFAIGLFGGLAAFDDATNSDRKVWTTAILSAAGGAVGGYFLGRALDKRRNTATVRSTPATYDGNWTSFDKSAFRTKPLPQSAGCVIRDACGFDGAPVLNRNAVD
jgi:hypothetical protein